MRSEQLVFLDTSIQIARVIGTKEQQAQIERELKHANCRFITSSYVFMEFQRSLWADFVYIYNQMRQCNDWADIAHQLRSGSRSHRPRSLGNCLQIFTWVLVESNLTYARALDFLELQVTQTLPEDFWLHVEPVQDQLGCDLVKSGMSLQPNGQYELACTCRKETAACHLPHFLSMQQSRLHSFATYLAVHPNIIKDQARVEHLLTTVIKTPQAAWGQSSCWPLGDVIIALQIPANASLWTLDADFRSLIEAFDLQLYQPTFNKPVNRQTGRHRRRRPRSQLHPRLRQHEPGVGCVVGGQRSLLPGQPRHVHITLHHLHPAHSRSIHHWRLPHQSGRAG